MLEETFSELRIGAFADLGASVHELPEIKQGFDVTIEDNTSEHRFAGDHRRNLRREGIVVVVKLFEERVADFRGAEEAIAHFT